MKSKCEDGLTIAVKSTTIGVDSVSQFAKDLIAFVDRLEAEVSEHRLAGAEFANQLHQLRLRSERLFDAA